MTPREFNALPPAVRKNARIQMGAAPVPRGEQKPAKAVKKTMARFIYSQIVSEANRRGHWGPKHARRVKQRNEIQHAFAELFGRGKPKRVTFILLTSQPMDDDNLRSALKFARDSIANLCGFNDREKVWRYDQRPRQRLEPRGCWIVIQF